MLLFHDLGHGFIQWHVRGERENLVPGHHDLAHGGMAKLKRVVDHFLFGFRQQAKTAAGGNDQLELVSGVGAAFTPEPRSKAAQHQVGGPVHDHQERMGQGHETRPWGRRLQERRVPRVLRPGI